MTPDTSAPVAQTLPDAMVRAAAGDASPSPSTCRHCGAPTVDGQPFCCSGCAAAYDVVTGLGLDAYYRRRSIDPDQRLLKPDADAGEVAHEAYAHPEADGSRSLALMVEGLHCAACVWLIESVLTREPGVVEARLNMTTRRLRLRWRPTETDAARLVRAVTRLGYRLAPYDAACLAQGGEREERELLRAMAVAGFAAGNVMLLSVSIWAGHVEGMGPATRDFLHWVSALITLPAIVYAGRPFFRAAFGALSAKRVVMEVPISIAVILAAGMSLHETIAGAPHAYFDAAVSLLFFLLVGRYLDRRARGRARSAAEHLLTLRAVAVTVIAADGTRRAVPPAQLTPGQRVLAATGERIAVDGFVVAGESSVDSSLIDGESTPRPARPGTRVFAGTLNIEAPLTIEVIATGEGTLLAEIARLVEACEQQRGRYVALADRVARLYAPVVHLAALATFLVWWAALGVAWQPALMNAIAVLIITCPCALGLAVPAVQVIATGRLLRRGILVKSGTALERLAEADTVAFDKTGTLTAGRPALVDPGRVDVAILSTAAALAASSRHPLCRALLEAAEARGLTVAAVADVAEVPGRGVEQKTAAGPVRLGSRSFCGIDETASAAADSASNDVGPELWLARPAQTAVRFAFVDGLRSDAPAILADLARHRYAVLLMSGDRQAVVDEVARTLRIADWAAGMRPADKLARLQQLAAVGQRVLMVGDGLNDAPALAAAHVSMSPSTAIDISQTAADVVFQGERLAPVVAALRMAKAARALVRQNLVLALGYNLFAVPLAMAGQVTPLVAAVVMSSSSILVIVNALRLNRSKI